MLGDMHENIVIIYLGTRIFHIWEPENFKNFKTNLDIYLHKFNLAKKYIPKRIDPITLYNL